MTTRDHLILGGGGHARVLAESLSREGRRLLGFTAPERQSDLFPGIRWLGPDAWVLEQDPEQVLLVNGLGSVRDTGARQTLFATFTACGYRFGDVIHPTCTRSRLDLRLGQGCQLLAGSLLGPGIRLGDNVLVNTRALVEHDCRVGDHAHIASGAVLCGGCDIGAGTHVGAGAVVIQGIAIGAGALVAAGSVVIRNVAPHTWVAGVPARYRGTL